MPRRIFNGPYETMDFPDYEFREYPKMLTMKDGAFKIAESQRHELELLTDDQSQRPGPIHPAEAEAASLAQANADLQAQMAKMQEQMALLLAAQDRPKAGDDMGPEGEVHKNGDKLDLGKLAPKGKF